MKCWKCSQETNERTQQCLFCGADQSRPEPRSELGSALRQLYDLYGCEKVLTDFRIIVNGIDDLADDTRKIKRQLTVAEEVHLGEMYLKQIREKGYSDPEFRELVSHVLKEDAQLSDKASEELIGYLDEMIGWPAEHKTVLSPATAEQENGPVESTEFVTEVNDDTPPLKKRKPHTAIIIAVIVLVSVIAGILLLNQQNGWFHVPWATPTIAVTSVDNEADKEETEVYITTEKGFSGDINVRAVMNKNKVIKDLTIDASCELPTIGGRWSSPEFAQQFIGKTGPFTYGENGVDSITGATVTSWAVLTAINRIYGVSMPTLQITKDSMKTITPTPTPAQPATLPYLKSLGWKQEENTVLVTFSPNGAEGVILCSVLKKGDKDPSIFQIPEDTNGQFKLDIDYVPGQTYTFSMFLQTMGDIWSSNQLKITIPTKKTTPTPTVNIPAQNPNFTGDISAIWNTDNMTWQLYLNGEDLSRDYARMAIRLNKVAKMEMISNTNSWGGAVREGYTLDLEKEPAVKFDFVSVESSRDNQAIGTMKLIKEDSGTTDQYEEMFKSLLKMMKEKLGTKVCGMMIPSELGDYPLGTQSGLEQAYDAMLDKSGYVPDGGFASVHFSVYGSEYTKYDDRGIWVKWYRSSPGENKIQVDIQFRQSEE